MSGYWPKNLFNEFRVNESSSSQFELGECGDKKIIYYQGLKRINKRRTIRVDITHTMASNISEKKF